ncbi:MAG: hemolysin family protein [Porphyromonadaceae bacterium]|nr:hemolysin family protein [Porphyromonadaceae bacterium]
MIILIILLFFSGFFSSAETALTTVNKIRMRSLAEEGNKRAKKVIAITEDSGKMLSAILIGNNIVNLSASSITTSIAYMFGGSAVAAATGIITLLILIFGEISPKTLATIHSEKLSLMYAYPIDFIMKITTPFIFIVNNLSRVVLFILRVDPNAKPDAMTESELRTIVDVSHEDGVIESEEKEMIYNVFDMGDAKAKDVMVPRVHMTFADVNNTYEELINIFREDKFTRLPVYEETTDNVIGTINMKDLLLFDNKKEFHIRDILREAYFTYEYKSISELLVEMREASFNIAIVLDEYGETAGLITLEDLLEEIVGEIRDEYDENEEDDFKEINKFEYVVEGSTNLDDLNDELHTKLESEDYDSLGGFIIERLDRLPELNDEVTTVDGIRLVVESLDKNRVEKVHIYLPDYFYAEKSEDNDLK